MNMDNKALLKWQIDMGADEAIADAPRNYFAQPAPIIAIPTAANDVAAPQQIAAMQQHPAIASASARSLVDAITNLDELEKAVREFDGCGLKKTASHTVFACGNLAANIMVLADAPAAEDDRSGVPFSGESGQLLDKMLASIGLNRGNCYITNSVFWRPPGNRPPSPQEVSICLPFVEKHIALIAPKLLILVGGTACQAILNREETISRLRGKNYSYQNAYLPAPLPAMVTYHPSFLLKQPTQKRAAWQDLLQIKAFIEAQAIEI